MERTAYFIFASTASRGEFRGVNEPYSAPATQELNGLARYQVLGHFIAESK